MPAELRHTLGYWFLLVFIAISVPLMLVGQTMAVVDYELAVSLGLQEPLEEVGELGVQVNRAFGASDTVVYIPLMLASLFGLWRGKHWSLITCAAVAGISVYWTVTIAFVFAFAPSVPGYTFHPGPEYAVFLGSYGLFGCWCIGYLSIKGDFLFSTKNGSESNE